MLTRTFTWLTIFTLRVTRTLNRSTSVIKTTPFWHSLIIWIPIISNLNRYRNGSRDTFFNRIDLIDFNVLKTSFLNRVKPGCILHIPSSSRTTQSITRIFFSTYKSKHMSIRMTEPPNIKQIFFLKHITVFRIINRQ